MEYFSTKIISTHCITLKKNGLPNSNVKEHNIEYTQYTDISFNSNLTHPSQ